MIKSLKVRSGFAQALLKRKLSFSDGLNVLFGPNGCGKTTALNIMAAHCCINYRDGGWSQYGGGKGFSSFGSGAMKERITRNTVGKCLAEVSWDGTPTLYARANILQSAHIEYDNPLMSVWDQITGLKSASDGEFKIKCWVNVVEQLHAAPAHDRLLDEAVKDKHDDEFRRHIESLPRDGKLTALLDEPDRSFSITNQSLIWQRLAKVSAPFQVIVASHSPFALSSGAKIINLGGKGHLDDCRRELREMAKRL